MRAVELLSENAWQNMGKKLLKRIPRLIEDGAVTASETGRMITNLDLRWRFWKRDIIFPIFWLHFA